MSLSWEIDIKPRSSYTKTHICDKWYDFWIMNYYWISANELHRSTFFIKDNNDNNTLVTIGFPEARVTYTPRSADGTSRWVSIIPVSQDTSNQQLFSRFIFHLIRSACSKCHLKGLFHCQILNSMNLLGLG